MAQEVAVKNSAEVSTRKSAAEIEKHVRERYASLLSMAPTEVDGEGALRIADRILSANSLEDIAAIWEKLDNSRSVAGKPLMFHGFTVHQSSYDDQDVFLTVDAVDRLTGAAVTFNTGAQSMVLTFLMAFKNDWFPFTGHVEVKTLTKTGYTASNLILDTI